jgi:hypothetical protein
MALFEPDFPFVEAVRAAERPCRAYRERENGMKTANVLARAHNTVEIKCFDLKSLSLPSRSALGADEPRQ